jgi:uncharacterized protein
MDFRDAVEIFDGDTVTMEDNRLDLGERRFVSLGILRGRVIVVVHSELGDITRIISARKATKYEQRIYVEGIAN